jgi:hypothetical protein
VIAVAPQPRDQPTSKLVPNCVPFNWAPERAFAMQNWNVAGSYGQDHGRIDAHLIISYRNEVFGGLHYERMKNIERLRVKITEGVT